MRPLQPRLWCSLLVLLVMAILPLVQACSRHPLDQAFLGALPAEEGNRTIAEYCQSCHAHKGFAQSQHLARLSPLYGQGVDQCRYCHQLTQDFWGHRQRLNRGPAQSTAGR